MSTYHTPYILEIHFMNIIPDILLSYLQTCMNRNFFKKNLIGFIEQFMNLAASHLATRRVLPGIILLKSDSIQTVSNFS